MARVMIICPVTKKPVPTGIAMDEQGFRTSQLIDNNTQCAACGQMHLWSKKDAFLESSQR